LIFVENPQEWSVDDVYYWAIGKVGIDEESASVLRREAVNGIKLIGLNEEQLRSSPYNLSRFATDLTLAIIKLKSISLMLLVFINLLLDYLP
jgi:hypothetical protein